MSNVIPIARNTNTEEVYDDLTVVYTTLVCLKSDKRHTFLIAPLITLDHKNE